MTAQKILLEEYRAERPFPFVWGTSDCLCFAAAVAMRITGRDPIAHLRGRYDSLTGARRVMAGEGWADMGAVAASIFPEIPLADARVGDWALVRNEDGTETIGVVAGATIAAKTEAGMGQAPRHRAVRAFRVS